MELANNHITALDQAEASMFHSDFCPYLELKAMLPATTPFAKDRFCSLFTSFYALDAARLSDAFKKHFFDVLFARKGIVNGQPDFPAIFAEIGAFIRKNGVSTTQFSFVSKLAGIHCESSPLYDRQVRKFFGAKEAKSEDEFVKFLRDVASNCRKWADDDRVKPILQRFKAHDHRLEQCDVVRLMDFLVWKAG